LEPGEGDLACGSQGKGRLADVEDIADEIITILSPKDFDRNHVIVTAGPTREPLDPVRFITNPSSGRMGFSIALALKHRGAQVTLISGPTALCPPRNVNFIQVRTAQEMALAVKKHFNKADIVIKSAAVADYRPKEVSKHKIKKKDSKLRLELERTPDILATLGKRKGERILVGFAAETQDLVSNARDKLQEKNLDMIVANDVSKEDIGFGSDVNQVTIVLCDGTAETLPPMSKDDLAHRILDRVAMLKEGKR
jgi:phosphopantothenoylcysteine decarboxylase/phosphopantothenate--cysteine ligase